MFFILLIICVSAENASEIVPTTVKSEVMLPITKPSIADFAMKEVAPNTTEATPKKTEFKPSPQLESYIEYNNFPIKQVWGEPKQVKTYQQIQQAIRASTPKSTKVIFATTPVSNAEEKQSYQNKPIRSDMDPNPLKFYDKYNYGSSVPFYQTVPSLDWTNSAFYTKPAVEHPYPFVNPEEHKKETYATPTSVIFEDEYEVSRPKRSPWKKIVKFLAAVIPIGLLLSALTPSILNVGPPVNNTLLYCRKDGARIDENHEIHIPHNLDFECSAREICENALKGRTPDLQNVRNVISSVIKATDEKNLIDLTMKSIHQKNCDMIPCTKIEKTTARQSRPL